MHKSRRDYKIQVQIYIDNSIDVFTTISFLTCGLWEKNSINMKSNQRKGKKLSVKETEKTHIYYQITFNPIKDSTKSLCDHTPLIFHLLNDFYFVFDFFARKMSMVQVNTDEDTYSICEYRELFINIQANSITNLDSFKKKINGYLLLNIQRKTKQKKKTQITYEDSEFYIINGCYLMPTAQSFYFKNRETINGALLDTTFSLMPNYKTSITMVSSFDLGVPLGFSFGENETKELYDIFYTTLRIKIGIDLSEIPAESDLGSALNGFCNDYGIIHFFCLRHFLCSLKNKPFSYEISLLVKSYSEKDLNQAKIIITNKLKKINDAKYKNLIRKHLNYIGFDFDKSHNLFVKDEISWMKVSQLKRIQFKMPSTTNSLESSHGQLNKKTPRRNNLWMSIFRIAKSMSSKLVELNKMYRHNFYYTKRRTLDKMEATSKDDMEEMIKFYNSTQYSCECGDNKIISSMLTLFLLKN